MTNRYYRSFIAALGGALLAIQPYQAIAQTFPQLAGETLAKTEIVWPEAREGQHTLFLVSFDRDQQAQMDSWIEAETDLPKNVSMRAVAIIGEVGGIAQFFIKGGMRDIYDKSWHERMMPYFGEADPIISELGLSEADMATLQIYLVAGSGEILWQEAGTYEGQFQDATFSAGLGQ